MIGCRDVSRRGGGGVTGLSKLKTLRWDVPGLGIVAISGTTPALLEEIDRAWPPLRRLTDVHHAWRWADLARDLAETFVVTSSDEAPLAIWGSKRSSALKLPSGAFYRLDNLEVSPTLRGADSAIAATFTLSVIGYRAKELGATGIVLATFSVEGIGKAYEARGATRGAPKGWDYPADLVPYVFGPDAVETLEGYAHELENQESK